MTGIYLLPIDITASFCPNLASLRGPEGGFALATV